MSLKDLVSKSKLVSSSRERKNARSNLREFYKWEGLVRGLYVGAGILDDILGPLFKLGEWRVSYFNYWYNDRFF